MTFYIVTEDTTYQQQLITDKHFGVNLVTIYDEEFVDPNNELSMNVMQLGATTLRFPGGSATENYFDMTMPNALVSTRDASQTLTPMDAFFSTAGDIGVAVTIVIPTQMAFDLSAAEAMLAGVYGDRQQVSATYLQDVATFVATAVAYAEVNGVTIEAFEIGNEFWGSGEMAAAEYGIVAGEVAVLLQQELAALGHADAEIIAQTTGSASRLYSSRDAVEAYVGYIDGEARAFTQDDINAEYGGVVPEGWQTVTVPGEGSARSQVTQIAAGINSVPGAADALDGIVQHYYQSGGFDKADGTKSFKFSQFQRLEDQLNRDPAAADMTYHITEWNTNATGAANNRGLQNASMMIENFFELVSNDVDAAQIWPLSFDDAQGISLVDLDGDDLSISGEMFRLMSESLPDSVPLFDWSVSGVIDVHGFAKETGAVFFVSERSGARQADVMLDMSQFLGGQAYFIASTQLWDGGAGGDDADAEPVLTETDGMMSEDVTVGFDLDSWANLRIEVTYVSDAADVITGRGGNDTIESLGGDDVIDAGDGADTIDAGDGDDFIFAGAGDDLILAGAGSDVIDGGAGHDTALFAQDMGHFTVLYDAETLSTGFLALLGADGEMDRLRDVEVLSFAQGDMSLARIMAYLDDAFGPLAPDAAESYAVAVNAIAMAPDLSLPPRVQMEVGRTSIEQLDSGYWQTVAFSEAIADASVIMGPASAQGGQPFAVRVRNITETGFEFQIDEWDYLDGYHKAVDISWLAATRGTHQLEDGSRMTIDALSTTSLDRVSVDLSGFDTAPMLFAQISGDAEAAAMTHRIDDVTADGFDFEVQLEEAADRVRSEIAPSLLHYAALDVAADSFLFSHGSQMVNHRYTSTLDSLEAGEAFFANMQTKAGNDPAVVRYDMASDGEVSLRVQEEKSHTRETAHADEDVAWFFIDEGVYHFV